MKTLLITLLGIGLATSLPAQVPEDTPPSIKLTAPELDELLGPVALYPDALISLILPAATAPMDIVLAARFVASDGELARVDEKPWEPSVRALTRYPDTLKWLDENLEWTAQVGTTFIDQPVEVMESIQRLRGMARALGNLVDTPQQRIVQDDTYIRIVPAQPDYIYEPRYDPYVVYYERPVSVPYLYFGLGFGVGSWLNYDCDWRRNRLYRGDWNEGWDYRYDNDRYRRDGGDNVYINNNISNYQEWRPDPVRHRTQYRSVAARISNDTNDTRRAQSLDQGTIDSRTADRKNSTTGRVQSNDLGVNDSRKRHERVSRPKAIAESTKYPEGVKRKEPNDRIKGGDLSGRVGSETDAGRMKEKNKEVDSKGRVAVPGSVAPGMPGDGKGKNKDDARDGGDRKKSADESSAVSPRIAVPPMKEGDSKGRPDMSDSKRDDGSRGKDAALKEELKRREESKRNEAPKREETQKKQEQDMPNRAVETRAEPDKRVEMPKREAPKQEEAIRKQDTPKRQEAAKQEAPRKIETPKREEPKREEVRKPQEMPKRQEVTRQEQPKRVEAPKREEPKREQVQKKQEMPKRQEVVRQEQPKRVEAPKREEPKRQEAPKKQDAPKRVEAPKQQEAPRKEAARPSAEPSKGKGKSAKEEEEERAKKKK